MREQITTKSKTFIHNLYLYNLMHTGRHQLMRRPHPQRRKIVNRYSLVGFQHYNSCIVPKITQKGFVLALRFGTTVSKSNQLQRRSRRGWTLGNKFGNGRSQHRIVLRSLHVIVMFSCQKATCQTSFGLLLLDLGQFSFIESNCHPYKKRKKKRKEGLSNKYIESTYNDNATNLLFLTISTFLRTCLEGSSPRKCKKRY